MKTEVIEVSSIGKGMDLAMNQVDETINRLSPDRKDALHLRLLAEEMFNMVRSVVGQIEGKFWIESADEGCQLHLKTVTLLDRQQQSQLISASSRGKNEAHRGIMGKIMAFFEPMPIDDTPAYLLDGVEAGENGELNWSLNAYKERLAKLRDTASDAQVEWDELEKSVVSHLADNVLVSIKGYDVDLIIYKKINSH